MTAEQIKIEGLTKELLFWKRCWKDVKREAKVARTEVTRLEEEIKDLTLEYGVEDRNEDIVWFCSPEDKRKSLEEQRHEALGYAMTDTWFSLVSRKVGPPRREI